MADDFLFEIGIDTEKPSKDLAAFIEHTSQLLSNIPAVKLNLTGFADFEKAAKTASSAAVDGQTKVARAADASAESTKKATKAEREHADAIIASSNLAKQSFEITRRDGERVKKLYDDISASIKRRAEADKALGVSEVETVNRQIRAQEQLKEAIRNAQNLAQATGVPKRAQNAAVEKTILPFASKYSAEADKAEARVKKHYDNLDSLATKQWQDDIDRGYKAQAKKQAIEKKSADETEQLRSSSVQRFLRIIEQERQAKLKWVADTIDANKKAEDSDNAYARRREAILNTKDSKRALATGSNTSASLEERLNREMEKGVEIERRRAQVGLQVRTEEESQILLTNRLVAAKQAILAKGQSEVRNEADMKVALQEVLLEQEKINTARNKEYEAVDKLLRKEQEIKQSNSERSSSTSQDFSSLAGKSAKGFLEDAKAADYFGRVLKQTAFHFVEYQLAMQAFESGVHSLKASLDDASNSQFEKTLQRMYLPDMPANFADKAYNGAVTIARNTGSDIPDTQQAIGLWSKELHVKNNPDATLNSALYMASRIEKLRAVSGMDTVEATRDAIALRQQLHMTATETNQFMDQVVYAATKVAVPLKSLGGRSGEEGAKNVWTGVKETAALLSSAGYTNSQIIALNARQIQGTGEDGGKVGNNLATMVAAMISQGKGAGVWENIIGKKNIEEHKTAERLADPEVMAKVVSAFKQKHLTVKAQQGETLKVVLSQAAETNLLSKDISKNSAGSLDKYADQSLDTYQGKLSKVRAAYQALETDLGNRLLPAAEKFAEYLFTTGIPAVQKMLPAIQAFGTGISSTIQSLSGFGTLINNVLINPLNRIGGTSDTAAKALGEIVTAAALFVTVVPAINAMKAAHAANTQEEVRARQAGFENANQMKQTAAQMELMRQNSESLKAATDLMAASLERAAKAANDEGDKASGAASKIEVLKEEEDKLGVAAGKAATQTETLGLASTSAGSRAAGAAAGFARMGQGIWGMTRTIGGAIGQLVAFQTLFEATAGISASFDQHQRAATAYRYTASSGNPLNMLDSQHRADAYTQLPGQLQKLFHVGNQNLDPINLTKDKINQIIKSGKNAPLIVEAVNVKNRLDQDQSEYLKASAQLNQLTSGPRPGSLDGLKQRANLADQLRSRERALEDDAGKTVQSMGGVASKYDTWENDPQRKMQAAFKASEDAQRRLGQKGLEQKPAGTTVPEPFYQPEPGKAKKIARGPSEGQTVVHDESNTKKEFEGRIAGFRNEAETQARYTEIDKQDAETKGWTPSRMADYLKHSNLRIAAIKAEAGEQNRLADSMQKYLGVAEKAESKANSISRNNKDPHKKALLGRDATQAHDAVVDARRQVEESRSQARATQALAEEALSSQFKSTEDYAFSNQLSKAAEGLFQARAKPNQESFNRFGQGEIKSIANAKGKGYEGVVAAAQQADIKLQKAIANITEQVNAAPAGSDRQARLQVILDGFTNFEEEARTRGTEAARSLKEAQDRVADASDSVTNQNKGDAIALQYGDNSKQKAVFDLERKNEQERKASVKKIAEYTKSLAEETGKITPENQKLVDIYKSQLDTHLQINQALNERVTAEKLVTESAEYRMTIGLKEKAASKAITNVVDGIFKNQSATPPGSKNKNEELSTTLKTVFKDYLTGLANKKIEENTKAQLAKTEAFQASGVEAFKAISNGTQQVIVKNLPQSLLGAAVPTPAETGAGIVDALTKKNNSAGGPRLLGGNIIGLVSASRPSLDPQDKNTKPPVASLALPSDGVGGVNGSKLLNLLSTLGSSLGGSQTGFLGTAGGVLSLIGQAGTKVDPTTGKVTQTPLGRIGTEAGAVIGGIGGIRAANASGNAFTGGIEGALSGASAGAAFGPHGALIGGIVGLLGGALGNKHLGPAYQPDIYDPGFGQFNADMHGTEAGANGQTYYASKGFDTLQGGQSLADQVANAANGNLSGYTKTQQSILNKIKSLEDASGGGLDIADQKNNVYTLKSGKKVGVSEYENLVKHVEDIAGISGSSNKPLAPLISINAFGAGNGYSSGAYNIPGLNSGEVNALRSNNYSTLPQTGITPTGAYAVPGQNGSNPLSAPDAGFNNAVAALQQLAAQSQTININVDGAVLARVVASQMAQAGNASGLINH